ncbi:hypothetical protein E2C01_041953 [Portunus trituberculatus]|uniref:Uncharacterized protein n=1 Tax=Portunus trituberculatus TaxID=210409 RepID=A0A5B7FS27_PORTR|nr:hypothetical protein [Portunus trituberculatus]
MVTSVTLFVRRTLLDREDAPMAMFSLTQRGRSLQSLGVRDNQIFERLYELAELLVWVTFRRRDRPVIHAEVTRLFRGAHHNHHQHHQQQGDDVANDPSFTAPPTHAVPTASRRRAKRGPPLSDVVRCVTTYRNSLRRQHHRGSNYENPRLLTAYETLPIEKLHEKLREI